MRAPMLDYWPDDPMPIAAIWAYRPYSAGWWRAVTAAKLAELANKRAA